MAPDTAPEITRLSSFSTTGSPVISDAAPLAPSLLTDLHVLVATERHADRVVGSVTLDERAARPPVRVSCREADRADHVFQLVLEVPVRGPEEPRLGEVLARLLEHLDEHVG